MNWTPGRIRFRNALIAIAPWAFSVGLQARFAFQTLPRWHHGGWDSPLPNLLKHSILVRYARLYQLTALVETGTYLGDTPWALRKIFAEIHTIELSPILGRLAKERFKRLPHIKVHEGDSARILPELLQHLTRPTLFWLDGHFSGGITTQGEISTPICDEVLAVAQRCPVPFVVLIDDARSFGSDAGYPSLDQFRERISAWLPGAQSSVENDIIAIVPRPLPPLTFSGSV
jgi:hypothetical protein